MPSTSQDHKQIFQLAQKNEVFHLAAQSAFNHMIITDVNGVVVFANDAVTRITGYPHDELIGSTPRMWGGQMDPAFYKKLWQTIKVKKKPFEGEIKNKRKNGDIYYARAVISPILDEKNRLIGFIGTEEDITVRKQLEAMKSEFISITAHQLKTPLTSINWNLEMLIDGDMGKITKKQKETLEETYRQNKGLVTLVNTLLNISRIESGRIAINPKPTSVQTIIEQEIEAMGPLFEMKKQIVNTSFIKTKKITTDPQFIGQIMHNLLSNASKYSQEETTIDVAFEKKRHSLIVSVTDHGYGIPKKDQTKIFQRFFRASNTTYLGAEGTGLGLYFVSLLVKVCKSNIWFESEEDIGTTFFVEIPYKGIKKKKGTVSLS